MMEMNGRDVLMTAGDFGIPLTIRLVALGEQAGEDLLETDEIRFSVSREGRTLVERDMTLMVMEQADGAFQMSFTKEDSAMLPPGLYTWKVELLRDGKVKNTLSGGRLTVTVLPVSPQPCQGTAQDGNILTVPLPPAEWGMLTAKGDYDPEETYRRLDLVHYDGGCYLVLKTGLRGVTPEDGKNYMLLGKVSETMPPTAHAASHGSGGSDPITPESIGAAAKGHSHTAAEVGAAAEGHSHTPESIGAAAEGHSHTPESIGAAAEGHSHTAAEVGAIPSSQKGVAFGVASLGADGKVPAAQLPEATGGGSGVNLLDNWYFVDPVNQRSVSGTITAAGYFIDRWKLISGSVQLSENGMILNGTIAQILETAPIGTVCAKALTASGAVVDGAWDAQTKTFTIKGTGQTFVAAKLELGDKQTLAHQDADGSWVLNDPFDFGQELLKCKRYYQKSFPYSIEPKNYSSYNASYSELGIGFNSSTSLTRVVIPLEVEMRAAPTTVTFYKAYAGCSSGKWCTYDTTIHTSLTPALQNGTGAPLKRLIVTLEGASGLKTGVVAQIMGGWAISADL